MSDLRQWLNSGRHLPGFLRDFHAQKDVFKTIGGIDSDGAIPGIPWTTGHIYVVDRFLPRMATYGYTLQRSRARFTFQSLEDAIDRRREIELQQLRDLVRPQEESL